MKTKYTNLLEDKTPCFDIDTSGTASEHELGDLARECGYPSLTSLLNGMHLWGATVGDVAALLLSHHSED